MNSKLDTFKQIIGIPNFQHQDLLETALTHPSYIYETNQSRQQQDQQECDYRRLAILGDAIASAIVVDYLQEKFTDFNQHIITQIKSEIVSRNNYYQFAKKLNLPQFSRLGGSERQNHESQQIELFGEMFEALFGAVYIEYERNFSQARIWLVENFIERRVEEIITGNQNTQQKLAFDTSQDDAWKNYGDVPEIQSLIQQKKEVDKLAAFSTDLKHLLTWINQKASTASSDYPTAKIRVFYLALIRILGLSFARNFDPNVKGNSQVRNFFDGFNRVNSLAFDLILRFNSNLDISNVIAAVILTNLEPQLQKTLQEIRNEMPHPKKEQEKFEQWRQSKGRYWLNKVIQEIGYNLQMSDQQKDILKKYYDANQSLLDSLYDEQIPPEVRQEIENDLLIPIS